MALVKICGLTRPDDVRAAIDAGADAIGIVLAEDSPRTVRDPGPLLDVAAGVLRVAVFRTWSGQPVEGFDVVQAFDFAGEPPLPALRAYRDGPHVERRFERAPTPLGDGLLDGPAGGGRGVPADWPRAARLAHRHRLVLAGGLTPDTVTRAIQFVRPGGVDVSSGVERAPGLKDPALVRAFVTNAHRVALEIP